MKRLSFLLLICWLALPAWATDRLDGVVPLAKDDLAAVARIKSTPERHVMLYFGDHLN
jgi:hypothetical protein